MNNRRDLWFDRAKEERNDLERETRMLKGAIRVLRENEDLTDVSSSGGPRIRSGFSKIMSIFSSGSVSHGIVT